MPFDPTILLFVLAGAAFWFLIIRPNKKRQQAQRDMISALQPGTEIMTTAGIFGTIAAVTDDQFSVEISPGVFIRIVHAAVARVVEPAAPAAVDSAAPAASDEPPVD